MRVDDFDSDDCSSAVPVSVSRSSLKLTLSRITRPARADAADSGRVRKASRGHRSLGPRKERQYIGRFPQEIEPWTHLVTSSPPVTRQPPPLWEDRTGNFFQRLPVSEDEWSRKRTRAGLTNEADLLRVYDQVCGRQSNGHTASPGAGTEGAGKKLDLSGLVKTYSSISVAGKLRQIIDQLLYRTFLATCIVASKQGCNLEDVDRAHRQYLEACGKSNDKGDNTLRRERATVLWELQEQQRQFRRGLLHRGFEIFIIEGRDLSFSIKCPKKPEENAEFTKKIPLCEVPVEFQASLPLWIPIFVKFRNYSEWSYSTICQALRVDLLSEESHFHAFETTYNKMSAASTADNLLAPDRSSVGDEQTTWIGEQSTSIGHDNMRGSGHGTTTAGTTLSLARQIDEGGTPGNTGPNTPSAHSHEEDSIRPATWINANVDEMIILDIPSEDPFWLQTTSDSPLF